MFARRVHYPLHVCLTTDIVNYGPSSYSKGGSIILLVGMVMSPHATHVPLLCTGHVCVHMQKMIIMRMKKIYIYFNSI